MQASNENNCVDNKTKATCTPEKNESLDNANSLGIIKELAELPEGALITEQGLAQIFNRHQISIKRAVQRGELPAPIRLFGMPTWTAGNILRHIEGRMEQAANERRKIAKKLSELRP